jgi:membrane fusion protein, multidrug efflux system
MPDESSSPPVEQSKAPARSNTYTKHWWLWALILLAAATVTFALWPKSSSAKTAVEGKKGSAGGAAAPVVGARAKTGDIGVYFTGLGSVTPIYTVTVKSRVDGELMEVRYHEGETVQKGDLLIQIDPRPYQVQLDQAEGQYAKDQAALANARVDLARYRTLVQQQAAPEQQLATQIAAVDQDVAVLKSDQAQIDSAKLNLLYCKITAPITGLVGLRLVDPGNIVHASDSNGLVVITQMEPISVLFTISEDQLPAVLQKLHAGQKLEVDAFDRQMQNKIAQGALTNTDNQIDQTTGTIRLRATFDNQGRTLFPNQFVNARLLVQEKHGVVLLPSAALQRTSTTTYVYLVQNEAQQDGQQASTVTVRNVTVGTTEGDNSEITSGLQPADVVVLTGADKLQEGSKVTVQIPGETTPPQPPAATPAKNKGGAKRK